MGACAMAAGGARAHPRSCVYAQVYLALTLPNLSEYGVTCAV